MSILNVLVDCVDAVERRLDNKLPEIRPSLEELYLENSKLLRLIEQFGSERSQRLKLLAQLNQKISLELNSYTPSSDSESIEVTLGTIQEVKEPGQLISDIRELGQLISPEKQKDLVRDHGQMILDLNIRSVETLSTLSNEIDFSDKKEEFIVELHDLRNQAEKAWRFTQLLIPSNEEHFQAAIMWASAQGEEDALEKLQNLAGNLPYNSQRTQHLIQYACQEIEERLYKKQRRYRVLCSQDNLQSFQGIEIIKSYSAFTIVLSSMEFIDAVKPFYPVERLENLEKSRSITRGCNMRDQVIRFRVPILESLKHKIRELDKGVKILHPLNRSEIVVSVPNEEIINQLKDFDEVEKVTPYEPEIRVQRQKFYRSSQTSTTESIATFRLQENSLAASPDYGTSLPGILIASFFTQEDRDLAAQNLASQGIQVIDRPGKKRLVLDLNSVSNAIDSLSIIENQVGLQSLEEKTIPQVFNDEARLIVSQGIIPSDPTPNLGLTGEGEIIAIADTGLDTGLSDNLHLDFNGRIRTIVSYPMQPSLNALVHNPGDDIGASDLNSGHGTHVAGTALGNGAQAQALNLSIIPAGIAIEAELIFQAIEQKPNWNDQARQIWENQGKEPPAYGLFGIPDDLTELFEEAYDEGRGAKIHSNSWGGSKSGVYNNNCQDIDSFVWEHKDFLVLVAAGNGGRQSSSGTPVIELGSVCAPGTAKNCLTVGASENNRSGQFSDTYGNRWPDDFPNIPFNNDGMVDSVDDIAAISSRGPCKNGRRLPDVIAPGTFILSTRSSQIANSEFAWGEFQPAREHYMYNGGTSMATPIVAGCAALVRQYLREIHQPSMLMPSAALIKAILIHSADYIEYRFAHPSSGRWADNEQGWGRVNLVNVLNAQQPKQVFFIDEDNGLNTGDKAEYILEIFDSSVPLKIILVYTDFPGEQLINNLNLVLYTPDNNYILGNDFQGTGTPDIINNVEGIVVQTPKLGLWRIEIIADVQEEQDYALVISVGGTLKT